MDESSKHQVDAEGQPHGRPDDSPDPPIIAHVVSKPAQVAESSNKNRSSEIPTAERVDGKSSGQTYPTFPVSPPVDAEIIEPEVIPVVTAPIAAETNQETCSPPASNTRETIYPPTDRRATPESAATGSASTATPQPPPIIRSISTSQTATHLASENASPKQSWVFRLLGLIRLIASRAFGFVSVIFLLAVAANIPIVQLFSFGYLLEVSGRLARKQRLRDAMIGLKKASVLGGIILGTWLTLLPVRGLSGFWYEAYLIDPESRQTQNLRTALTVVLTVAIMHIASVWFCGGKLRYFFWPLIAPFSFGIWVARRLAGTFLFRKILSWTVGLLSPVLVDDICNVEPISDWFVPALCLKRIRAGNVYVTCRDGVWDFVHSLNLVHYFMLGLKGLVGTVAWLSVPTALLVLATYSEDGMAILSGLFGVIIAIPVFMVLPFLQAHFATDGRLRRFVEIRAVFKNYGRAPFAHVTALLFALALALPLFVLKIEQIPAELVWSLSIVFILFSWPARVGVGWAYGRGANRDRSTRWWIRYPLVIVGMPIALAFALILTLTRYVSWDGALSLIENHVFLLPAPFWM